MRALAAVALALASAVAGCTEPTELAGPTGPAPSDAGVAVSWNLTAPSWVVGQWWTYTVSAPGGPAFGPWTYVVSANMSDHYVLDTTDRTNAAFDAEQDTSFIGKIGKADLGGLQNGQKVQYFRFPLTLGDQWNTQWDGVDRAILVTAADPDGDEYEFLASEAGKPRVRYSLDLEEGFFGFLDFLDEEGGSAFRMELQDSGLDYRGTFVRAVIRPFLSVRGSGPSTPNSDTFSVPDGLTDLEIRHNLQCPTSGNSWQLLVAPMDPQNASTTNFSDQGTCPDTRATDHFIPTPKPGEWTATGRWTFATGPDTFDLTILGRIFTESTLA